MAYAEVWSDDRGRRFRGNGCSKARLDVALGGAANCSARTTISARDRRAGHAAAPSRSGADCVRSQRRP
jgi:hypothetical protein